ncbi:MAG: hypothetical protein V1913_10110 [Fibrobacterota bacterium]
MTFTFFYISCMRILLAFILFTLITGCMGEKKLSVDRYARFYARQALLEQYYQGRRDSIDFHVAALYQSENVTPGQIRTFLEKQEKDPESWVTVQEHIVRELVTLDPRAVKVPVPAPPVPKPTAPIPRPTGKTLGRIQGQVQKR